MSEIFITDDILTNEIPSVILTDEIPIGRKGIDGKDGRDGLNGKDGINGINGINGRDGIDGKNGLKGKNGSDGRDGSDGKDGRDGYNGIDGNHGENGKDGTKWFYFKKQLDHEVGQVGDFSIIQETSQFFRKENSAGQLLWKYKGNLKGEKGERGEQGEKGSSGGTIIQQIGGDFAESFETVSKNLKSSPFAIDYDAGKISKITYTTAGGLVYKDFEYLGDNLVKITLSGSVPVIPKYEKNFTYSLGILDDVFYT